MLPPKKEHATLKESIHPRNLHRARYDFESLVAVCPELKPFVIINKYEDVSINFFDPLAVKMLNKALLKKYYQIDYWDIPENYLCPPIPGRADYLHHFADLLSRSAGHYGLSKIPKGKNIVALDIGVGANCVYPIIGNRFYGWHFIGSDLDPIALKNAEEIVANNKVLLGQIDLRLQNNPNHILKGVLKANEKVDFTICNPPFHSSLAEAQAGSLKKLSNLKKKKVEKVTLNFGGKVNELWCPGGEERFVKTMIRQSQEMSKNCFWFSTLLSKQDTITKSTDLLEELGAIEIRVLPMGQGNKISRVLAWTFLSKREQENWVKTRWQ
jgi:23S rRNA (adenine1618-N6)-methyltransferase